MTSNTNQDTSEMEGTNTVEASEPRESTESVVPADPLAQLEAELKVAKTESAEWQDRFLRKAAEFENFRKRSDKEKVDARLHAQSSILAEFLPITDACQRALKIFADNQEAVGTLQQYKEGVELLYRQFMDTLNRIGVVAMQTEGQIFDPHLHEALSRQVTTEFKEGTIVMELRQGYMFKDKLLRPAQVVVAVPPQEKDPVNQ
jgi:molecular chaperone GrpE